MENFQFYNPVQLVFGRGQLEKLPNLIPDGVERVLVVYGGGSIKRNGIYTNVMKKLENYEVFELGGVEPNPRITTVNRGADLCKQHNIDFILAVGGGSVIDCTKSIAVGAKYDGDAWDLVTRKVKAPGGLPFGTVLTAAATGSEMNRGSVITNWETNEKYGWGSQYTWPLFSILDPVHTYSVPREQTVYGIVDMMSHILEDYFHKPTNAPVQDRMAEGILRTIIETAPKLLKNLESYEYRETIMYAGTIALNGFLQMGYRGDWATHNIEHAVSAVYDIPHAGGLAILFPNWMEHNLNVHTERFKQMAVRVLGVDPTGKSDEQVGQEGIDRLRKFWTALGAPTRLADYDIDDSQLDVMVEKAMANGPFGNFKTLHAEDVHTILRQSL
ncbi:MULTISPECIES: iron-containing alcohol dehydrogenase [Allobacillus]|uniref:Iron-containing alcohol dehydrogenase n=1 Tax=Allobacillus halotolerans TaxID=570278 RepID=A0ABS6GPJ3_9BACI|nr:MULTISPECIES: iron-containing alcohol dehydrogenase [Allobacillus]MBU6080362.1 iron-containing alcohol dehydrogenase [Allobacillus halotolerans]TSJ65154.1 iron-containing alcohol dehydrogenase [Allobacillus sp. SKP2-8]